MKTPDITCLTHEDIVDFQHLLDQMPHVYAKHLSAWLDLKILAQVERNAEAEKQLAEMLVEIDEHRRAVAAGEKPSFFQNMFPKKPPAPESDADPTTVH